MPADMLDNSVETLKNMNSQTAKYAKWYVRVLDPKVQDYTFTARGEKVEAAKFTCVLVSNAPKQYMLGSVPFNFQNRNAAVEASRTFTAGSVWELKNPGFDIRAKPEFIGCPLKSAVMLGIPSTLTRVLPTSPEALAHPAKGLQVALDIKGIVGLLKENAAGATQRSAFDFCGKFIGIGAPKSVTKGASSSPWPTLGSQMPAVGGSWWACGKRHAVTLTTCNRGLASLSSDALLRSRMAMSRSTSGQGRTSAPLEVRLSL